MNEDAFKILLLNGLIPLKYKTERAYLLFDDVYNLQMTCKQIRNKIESFSKMKCRDFNDFELNWNKKLQKYKTWYRCLLFWNCKFPVILLKHLSKSYDTTKRRIFVQIDEKNRNNLDHLIVPTKDNLNVFPKIEYTNRRFMKSASLNSVDDFHLMCDERRFRDRSSDSEDDDEEEYVSECIEIFKGTENFKTYEQGIKYLGRKGYFSINKFELLEDLINTTQINQFWENDDVWNEIKQIVKLREYQVTEFTERFPKSLTRIDYVKECYCKLRSEKKIYKSCKYSVMLMKNVCEFFKSQGVIEKEPSLHTFVGLCNSLKFIVGWSKGICEFNFK